MAAKAAEEETGGRKEIAMAVVPIGVGGRSAALAGAGTGGRRGIEMIGAWAGARGRNVGRAGAGVRGGNNLVAPREATIW